jgi:hypothetical protein
MFTVRNGFSALRVYCACLSTVLFCLIIQGNAGAQILTNGNFGGTEPNTPSLSGWTTSLVSAPPGTAPSLKASDNESIDNLNDYANAHFNTGNCNAGSTLSQSFTTAANQTYT